MKALASYAVPTVLNIVCRLQGQGVDGHWEIITREVTRLHGRSSFLRLPYTEPCMWVAGLGAGRHFTHFEVEL